MPAPRKSDERKIVIVPPHWHWVRWRGHNFLPAGAGVRGSGPAASPADSGRSIGLREIWVGLNQKAVFVNRAAWFVGALVELAQFQQLFGEGAVDLIQNGLNVLLGGEVGILLLNHHQLSAGVNDIAGVELDAAKLRQRGKSRPELGAGNLIAVGVALDVGVVGVLGEIEFGVVEIIIGGGVQSLFRQRRAGRSLLDAPHHLNAFGAHVQNPHAEE